MEGTVGRESSDVCTEVDDLCAGARPAQNGLEERLDMLVAQLSVIAIELHEISEKLQWMR